MNTIACRTVRIEQCRQFKWSPLLVFLAAIVVGAVGCSSESANDVTKADIDKLKQQIVELQDKITSNEAAAHLDIDKERKSLAKERLQTQQQIDAKRKSELTDERTLLLRAEQQRLQTAKQRLKNEQDRIQTLDEKIARLSGSDFALFKQIAAKAKKGELTSRDCVLLEALGGRGVTPFVAKHFAARGRERGSAELFNQFGSAVNGIGNQTFDEKIGRLSDSDFAKFELIVEYLKGNKELTNYGLAEFGSLGGQAVWGFVRNKLKELGRKRGGAELFNQFGASVNRDATKTRLDEINQALSGDE